MQGNVLQDEGQNRDLIDAADHARFVLRNCVKPNQQTREADKRLTQALPALEVPPYAFDKRRSANSLVARIGDWMDDVCREANQDGLSPSPWPGRDAQTIFHLNSTFDRLSLPAWQWLEGLNNHGRKAWGEDYSEARVDLVFGEMVKQGLILHTESYHAQIFGNRDIPIQDRYSEEVTQFFLGEDNRAQIEGGPMGHVWISRHPGTHDVLVVEPPTGGQFEVAVRVRGTGVEEGYVGYSLGHGRLYCHNTEH